MVTTGRGRGRSQSPPEPRMGFMEKIRRVVGLIALAFFLLGPVSVLFHLTTFRTIGFLWGTALVVLLVEATRALVAHRFVFAAKWVYLLATISMIIGVGNTTINIFHHYRPNSAEMLVEKMRAEDQAWADKNRPQVNPEYYDMILTYVKGLNTEQIEKTNQALAKVEKIPGLTHEQLQEKRIKVILEASGAMNDNWELLRLSREGKPKEITTAPPQQDEPIVINVYSQTQPQTQETPDDPLDRTDNE